MKGDELYMKLALKEAEKGLGRTSPNPAVGAVIVRDGVILARGYHKKAATPHAEINAINSASGALEQATLYVTLEPCSHTGKTPPCCEAIARTGISRVVIGMIDPNPLVSGRGIAYLRSQGIEVVSGILQGACEEINRPFIKYIKGSIPYMIMKAGISLDGRLSYQAGVSGAMTGEKSRKKVHQLRNRYDSIMVGCRTVIADNPSLTTRLEGKKRDPVRIILDTHLSTPVSAKVYNQDSEAVTLLICSNLVEEYKIKAFAERGVRVLGVDSDNRGLDLRQVLFRIGAEGITSVLVEGGGALHGSLLREQLYDYAYLFYAPVFAGDTGQSLVSGMDVLSSDIAPRIAQPRYQKSGEDMLVSGRIRYQV